MPSLSSRSTSTIRSQATSRPAKAPFNHRKRQPEPFNLVPSVFLAEARRLPPMKLEPTASRFSSWTYSLYSHAIGKEEDRERGKEVEQDVLI